MRELQNRAWSKWQILELPELRTNSTWRNACAQWLVLPDGTPLVPIYFAKASQVPASVTVLRCAFDGEVDLPEAWGRIVPESSARPV